jgi:hypothetical protein
MHAIPSHHITQNTHKHTLSAQRESCAPNHKGHHPQRRATRKVRLLTAVNVVALVTVLAALLCVVVLANTSGEGTTASPTTLAATPAAAASLLLLATFLRIVRSAAVMRAVVGLEVTAAAARVGVTR